MTPGIPPLPTHLWPHKPSHKQLMMLLTPERNVLWGGAAGGGKSDGLLMVGSQYADYPNYRALFIRRTFADLMQPGALLNRAIDWWHDKFRYEASRFRFVTPAGAVLQFGHLADPLDHLKYQGSELTTICIDEASQIRPEQIQYLASRLRRPLGSDLPIRMRLASNPGGVAHEWLREQFVKPDTPDPDYRFIPAMMHENPGLDIDAYRKQLEQLDPVTKAQLLLGDWDVRIATGWLEVDKITLTRNTPECTAWTRAWDLASTAGAGDYTAGVLIGKTHANSYHIADIQRGQWAPADVEQRIRSCAAADPAGTRVCLEQEPGSAGIALMNHYARTVLPGADFRRIRATGPKTARAAPLAAAIANSLVSCQQTAWTQSLLSELAAFPDGVYDDCVDACAMAYSSLARPERREQPAVFAGSVV